MILPDGTSLYSGERTMSSNVPPINIGDFANGRITSCSVNATAAPVAIMSKTLFQSIPNLVSFSAPDLVMAGQLFGSSSSFPNLTSLSFPELVIATGQMHGTFNALTALSFPKLRFLNQLSIVAPAATTVSFPVLESVSSTLGGTLNAATSLTFPELRACGGIIVSASAMTTLALPKLRAIGPSGFNVPAPLLATITLPPLGQWKALMGNVTLTSGSLTQATVDALLAQLAYMDGNNGTLVYGTGRTVAITGSNAAPSNLGSTTTAGSNFVCSGTTCTVNWTNHGYATNDVLRISGITGPAGNANRYARITVVNANQFTYTISTQTGTGTGTATVIRAGASASALVTRGVTLTTN